MKNMKKEYLVPEADGFAMEMDNNILGASMLNQGAQASMENYDVESI